MPYNLEAEQSFLGAILFDNTTIENTMDLIKDYHLYEPLHQEIYQACLILFDNNKLADPTTLKGYLRDKNPNRKIWMFCGDGEMDEPESMGSISLAAREKLNNLIFVINCNLQRLDGPVRGNSRIITELGTIFKAAGWNVINLIWGRRWDELLAKDYSGALRWVMNNTVDGEYQNFKAKGGAYTRKHFFGKHPEALKLVEEMSDDEIEDLNRGGHDPLKVFNAYKKAYECTDKPSVILAFTVKGYGIGSRQADNTTHQVKKLTEQNLIDFIKKFDLPIDGKKLMNLEYLKFNKNSKEYNYLQNINSRNNFTYLHLDPQEHVCMPFHNNVPSRMVEKDYFSINTNYKK